MIRAFFLYFSSLSGRLTVPRAGLIGELLVTGRVVASQPPDHLLLEGR